MQKRNKPLVDDYKILNPDCELWHLWKQVASDKWNENKRRCIDGPASEVHHIMGGCHRWDLECNIISVCRSVHDWLEADSNAGQIVCWKAKLDKGEFDPETITEFSGVNPIGWLIFDKVLERCENDATLERWRHELWIASGGY